jgi:hypothetical protein
MVEEPDQDLSRSEEGSMSTNGHTAAGVALPDTKLAREATELVRFRRSGRRFEVDRAEITALHPRPDFKRNILQACTDGIAPKPETTFGNVKADVLERFVPGYQRGNVVGIIENSAWPE